MAEILNQLKGTIMKLKEQLTERDKKIADLEDKMKTTNDRLASAEGARANLSKKYEDLQNEFAQAKKTLSNVKEEEYKKEMESAKKTVEAKNVKIADLEDTIKKMAAGDAILKKFESSLGNATSKVAAQEKQIAALNIQISSMQANNKDMLEKLERETERAKKLNIQIDTFKKEVDILNTELKAKSPELAEMGSVKARLQETKDENARMKTKETELVAEIAKLKADIKDKESKITMLYEIQGGQKREEGIISSLRNEISQLKLKNEEAEAKYKSISFINTNLSAEVELANKEIKTLKDRPDLTAEKKDIIDKQAVRIAALEGQLKNAEDEAKHANEALSKTDQPELLKKAQHANTLLIGQLKELQKFESEFKNSTTELTRLKEALKSAEQLYKIKSDEVGELKNMISDLEKKLAQQNELFGELSKLTSV